MVLLYDGTISIFDLKTYKIVFSQKFAKLCTTIFITDFDNGDYAF